MKKITLLFFLLTAFELNAQIIVGTEQFFPRWEGLENLMRDFHKLAPNDFTKGFTRLRPVPGSAMSLAIGIPMVNLGVHQSKFISDAEFFSGFRKEIRYKRYGISLNTMLAFNKRLVPNKKANFVFTFGGEGNVGQLDVGTRYPNGQLSYSSPSLGNPLIDPLYQSTIAKDNKYYVPYNAQFYYGFGLYLNLGHLGLGIHPEWFMKTNLDKKTLDQGGLSIKQLIDPAVDDWLTGTDAVLTGPRLRVVAVLKLKNRGK